MGSTVQNDIIRATAHFKLGFGQDMENVFYFKKTTAGSIDDSLAMQDIAAKFDGAYTLISGIMASSVATSDVKGFNVTQNRPMPDTPWPTLVGGASSSDRLPDGVAALGLLRTGVKRVLGRKFLGGLVESATTGGTFTNAALTVIASFLLEWITDWIGTASASHWLTGVIDKTRTFHEFQSMQAAADPAYQRRRRVGRGS